MRRACLTAAITAVSLFAFGGVALADDPPGVPPAFAPPVVAPVVDVPSANAFAENYASDNARRFLNQDRRRVRVIDADAACLQSPVLATRFGCVFTLRALVINRIRGWDNWGHGDSRSHPRARSADDGGHGHKRHDRNRHQRFRVRQFGCLGFLRINGGPTVTPTAQVVNVECARIPRGDTTLTEDVAPA
jgi:hypothetical protein